MFTCIKLQIIAVYQKLCDDMDWLKSSMVTLLSNSNKNAEGNQRILGYVENDLPATKVKSLKRSQLDDGSMFSEVSATVAWAVSIQDNGDHTVITVKDDEGGQDAVTFLSTQLERAKTQISPPKTFLYLLKLFRPDEELVCCRLVEHTSDLKPTDLSKQFGVGKLRPLGGLKMRACCVMQEILTPSFNFMFAVRGLQGKGFREAVNGYFRKLGGFGDIKSSAKEGLKQLMNEDSTMTAEAALDAFLMGRRSAAKG